MNSAVPITVNSAGRSKRFCCGGKAQKRWTNHPAANGNNCFCDFGPFPQCITLGVHKVAVLLQETYKVSSGNRVDGRGKVSSGNRVDGRGKGGIIQRQSMIPTQQKKGLWASFTRPCENFDNLRGRLGDQDFFWKHSFQQP